MKNLIFVIAMLFSMSVEAETISFNAGMTHESCINEGVDRVCDLYPLSMETIEMTFESTDYAFAELRRSDAETGAQFSTHFSAVKYEEDGELFYDFYIAMRSSADLEKWNYNKVRLRKFEDLNHLILTGQPVKHSKIELTVKLFIAPNL